MNSQQLGRRFEEITKEFFLKLFEETQFQVNNNWIQPSGTQYGFDVGFEIAVLNDNFFTRGVYIECKNYKKTKLNISKLHTKLINFDRSDFKKIGSIFIFLSPRVDLSKASQDLHPKALEDYFNREKEFKTIILTPNSHVREILALDKAIFKKVYEGEEFIELSKENRQSILEYFRKLFYSKGEIPNFKDVSKRKAFLEEASIKDFKLSYVNRTIAVHPFSYFKKNKTLIEAVKDNNSILLLGEPGSGKTTELKNLADYFEEGILELEITPVFVSLSDVKNFNTIEDILPSGWNLSSKVILLFDALDEFKFKDRLGSEVYKLFENKEINIKIVISCRTYAYNDELSKLKPKKYHLQGFSTQNSYDFLKKNYNFKDEDFNRINTGTFKDVLEDPFLLEKLGLYLKIHNKLPENASDIFNFIKDEYTDEDVEKYKTLSLLFAFTRKTTLTKKELKLLFGVFHKRIIKLDLIQKSFNGKYYKFTHKNYQRILCCFSYPSEKSFNDIKKIIQIKGTKKTHPSLLNVITFLINLLDENTEKYSRLIKWLESNEPELLFKADHNRIKCKLRVQIFGNYILSATDRA